VKEAVVPTVPPFFWVAAGRIIGGYRLKWNGRDFDSATSDEEKQFGSQAPGAQFSNINGWSSRAMIRSMADEPRRVSINITGHELTVIVRFTREPFVAVEIQRDGQEIRKLWQLDQRPQAMKGEDYRRVFGTDK
jgi:hypothetical protein